jgi:hypothetical protein
MGWCDTCLWNINEVMMSKVAVSTLCYGRCVQYKWVYYGEGKYNIV